MPSNIRVVDASEDRRSSSGRPVVFVVDDDVATLGLLCEVAFDLGWDCRGFHRLRQVREAIAAGPPPSLLILDDELPDGLGGDLARELREDPVLGGIPVLVCTAAHPMRRAEIGSWAPVVAKPFDLGAVERFLESAHPGSALSSRDDKAG